MLTKIHCKLHCKYRVRTHSKIYTMSLCANEIFIMSPNQSQELAASEKHGLLKKSEKNLH